MVKRIANLFIILFISTGYAEQPVAAPNVWQPVADQICVQIKEAIRYYEANDLKNAHATAIMAYFKGYDTELEPAVRITLGGPHVFAVERQFRDFSAIMTPAPDKQQLKKVAAFGDALCKSIHDDAKALHNDHVSRRVFNAE